MSTTKTAAFPEKEPMPTGARILCVGDESNLLIICCEVLTHAGYDSQTATIAEAEDILIDQAFDLIIVSAFLSEANQQRVLSAAGATPTLVLYGLTTAPELLAGVEARLSNQGSH
jgi:DNA-binding response OmpR family regulator